MGQGVSRRSLGGIRHIFSACPSPAPEQAVKKPCLHDPGLRLHARETKQTILEQLTMGP